MNEQERNFGRGMSKKEKWKVKGGKQRVNKFVNQQKFEEKIMFAIQGSGYT